MRAAIGPARLARIATELDSGFVELTKQRKVYIAILGCAGLALGIDRFVLDGGSGPAKAGAAISTPAGETAQANLGGATQPTSAKPVTARLTAMEAPMAALARRMERLPLSDDAKADAFTTPPSWPGAQPATSTSSASVSASAGAVTSPYRLTSVSDQAVVVTIANAPTDNNTRLLRLGGDADQGMRLVSLELAVKGRKDSVTTAVIEVGEQRFTLTQAAPQAFDTAKPKPSSKITPKKAQGRE